MTASFTVTINSGTTGSVSNTALWAGPGCATDPQGPVPVEAAQGAPGSNVVAGPTPCPTNTTTTVTPPIAVTITVSNTSTTVGTVPTPTCSVTGDTLGAPATGAKPATAAPVTAPSTTPSIAFTGALLDQEWIAGMAAVLLGAGLLAVARRRRRSPRHAARR